MEDIIILNNREFLIIDNVCLENNKYIYVIATNGSNEFSILHEYEKDGIKHVKSVTDTNIINKVFEIITKK